MGDLTFGTWSATASPVSIEYSLVVIEEIRQEVAEGFQKLSRGGIEVGGLLYGVHDGSMVRIMAIRAAACEHAAGPTFRLSERDRAALQEQIRRGPGDARLDGLECVGWYVSHTRTEIAMTESDLEIFSSYFAEPWKVTLVIRPSRGGNMRAGFFVWEPDGKVNAAQSYQEFSFPDRLAGAFDRGDSRPEQLGVLRGTGGERARGRPVPERRSFPSAPPQPPPPEPEATPLEIRPYPQPAASSPGLTSLFSEPPAPAAPAPAPQTAEAPKSVPAGKVTTKKWMVLAAALIVIAALVAGGARFLTSGAASETIALGVLEREGQLDIEWNRAAAPVSKAVGGTLEITDGPQTRNIPLKPADLALGKFSYKRESGDIQVRMIVEEAGGEKVQEASRFLGPPPAKADTGELEALQKRRDELEAEVNRLKQSNDQQGQRIQQLERTLKILQTRQGN